MAKGKMLSEEAFLLAVQAKLMSDHGMTAERAEAAGASAVDAFCADNETDVGDDKHAWDQEMAEAIAAGWADEA